jgi:hypothetical protein
MAFTFTPVVAGNPVLATDLQGSFNNLQTYINGGAVSGDVAANVFQKHHIVKGTYQPIPNTFNFVSGINGGQNFTGIEEKLSFLTQSPTLPIGGEIDRKYYQQTALTFYVEKECTAMFQFFACPLVFNYALSTTTANEREATINIHIDGNTNFASKLWTHEEWFATNPQQRQREFWSNFITTRLGAGFHSIGLEGYTNANNVFLINWGFTVECWHDNRAIPNGTLPPNYPQYEPQ